MGLLSQWVKAYMDVLTIAKFLSIKVVRTILHLHHQCRPVCFQQLSGFFIFSPIEWERNGMSVWFSFVLQLRWTCVWKFKGHLTYFCRLSNYVFCPFFPICFWKNYQEELVTLRCWVFYPKTKDNFLLSHIYFWVFQETFKVFTYRCCTFFVKFIHNILSSLLLL